MSARQVDFIRDDPQVQAQLWRTAAETARHDFNWSPEDRERRAAYYEAEARRIEVGTMVPAGSRE